MKRLIIILLATILPLFASAQNRSTNRRQSTAKTTQVKKATGWQVSRIDADELKNRQAQSMYTYEISGKGYFSFSSVSGIFLRCNYGIFDYEIGRYKNSVNATIGFYNKQNSLISKSQISFEVFDDDPSGCCILSGPNNKIINFLKDKSGDNDHIRIIASVYGKVDLDLTIPMLPDNIISELSK